MPAYHVRCHGQPASSGRHLPGCTEAAAAAVPGAAASHRDTGKVMEFVLGSLLGSILATIFWMVALGVVAELYKP